MDNGQFDQYLDCQAQCRINPFVPIDLLGNWRGRQIQKGYVVGEWKAVFTNTMVTITQPNGDKITATAYNVGQYLTLELSSGPQKGKKNSNFMANFIFT